MATPDVAFGLYKFGVVMSETKSPDRNLAMELVRVTEAAAMAAARWMGSCLLYTSPSPRD